jgi:transcriptional regulator
VHAIGEIELTDATQTVNALGLMLKKYEPNRFADDDFIPEEYQTKLMKGIVGFKMRITDLQAKEKLGQHRNHADQRGVTQALSQAGDLDAQQLYAYMLANNIGTGS